MKYYLRVLLLAFLSIALLGSCKTKEERVIDQLQGMSERIEKKGDSMSSEDWEKLYKEYSDIHAKIANEEYDFTDEQMRELGRVEGKLGKAFVKQSMKDFGKATEDILKKGSEFLKGVMESDDKSDD